MTRTSARALAVAIASIVGGALAGCGSDEPSAADYQTDVNTKALELGLDACGG